MIDSPGAAAGGWSGNLPDPVRVGLIGCGAISAAYLKTAPVFPIIEIVACADLDRSRAEARAAEFGVPRVTGPDELLADPEVEVVLNLTVPRAHASIALAALQQGKHVFNEKPLAVDRSEGEAIRAAAAARGLRVGCAPDTFLGAGIQTARALIDGGAIGRPVAFSAVMHCRGHEHWHPSPAFYYEPGGGPMFDMGPYYLTALLQLLGPVRRYAGLATVAIPDRIITSRPLFGTPIRVETPDHVCGLIEFEGGAAGTISTSFAVLHPLHDGRQPIAVHGTEGTLRVPDPNGFDGPVHLRRGDGEWEEVPHDFPTGYGRAVGLADMASALRHGRPHRCSLEQACTVLDLMRGFLDSSAAGVFRTPEAPYQRLSPMPRHLPFGTLDP
jgi:predicted dehydrogenase